MRKKSSIGGWAAGVAALLFSAAGGGGQSRVVNCIAAVVNNEIITRTDVEIADALEIFESAGDPDTVARRGRVLEKLIDRLIVLAQVRGATVSDPVQVESEWAGLVARLGVPTVRGRLDAFGMAEGEARELVAGGLRFRRIIADRFGRSVSVTLKEIETYYADVYSPARKKEGLGIKPLVEVFDAIEAELKRAKTDVQAALWIETLRDQAEIEIRPNCLK